MNSRLQPVPAILERVEPLVPDHHVFVFRPRQAMPVAPGQFVEISIPGVGGFPVSVCEAADGGLVVSCIRKAGRVTTALFGLEPGAQVGLRGPFGNGFDLKQLQGRDVLLMAGGLGMAPLRALLHTLLDAGARRRLIILYGARKASELLFRDELVRLASDNVIELLFSVDVAEGMTEIPGTPICKIGLVTELLDGVRLQAETTAAVVSGPPALYRSGLEKLAELGLQPALIHATLERRMRCGIGQCCHCVTGGIYICREGPVFSLAQLRNMEGAI